MPLLRIKFPDQREITHELTEDRITIGRRPDNLIQIMDSSVSAYHAELLVDEGHYRLHDLKSTNLTLIDGTPVVDFHLRELCNITFGVIQCEFDPLDSSGEIRLSPKQMERELAFLRGENSELQGKIVTLERQLSILGSARLVTKKTESTPFSAANDTLRAICSERDDLRHLSTGLKLELENLRKELSTVGKERDAARQALDLVQAAKVGNARHQHTLRQRTGQNAPAPEPAPPPAGLTVIAQTLPAQHPKPILIPRATLPPEKSLAYSLSATQRITLPLSPEYAPIARALEPVTAALRVLRENPKESTALIG